MTKYIADFVLDSDVRIPDNESPIEWQEDGNFSVKIFNIKDGFSKTVEALSVHLIFESQDLHDAKERSQDLLAQILNSLVWVTMSQMRQAKLVRIVDWSSGLGTRDSFLFHESPRVDIAEPFLTQTLLDSAKQFDYLQNSETAQSAMRWFRLAIGSESLETQFIYMWFALETAANKIKSSGKHPIECPKCQSALYCSECEAEPKRKKMSLEAIKDFLKRTYESEEDALVVFKTLTKYRHAIMHARRIESVSTSAAFDEIEATNRLAFTARQAIIQLCDKEKLKEKSLDIEMLGKEYIVRGRKVVTAHVNIGGFGNPENPTLPKETGMSIKTTYPDQPAESD